MSAARSFARRSIAVAGLSAVSLLSIGGLAQAQTSSTTSGSGSATAKSRPAPPTADQQACLTGKGFPAPVKPTTASDSTTSSGSPGTQARPAKVALTADQKAAFDAAAKACGLTPPAAGHGGPGAGRPGGGKGDRPELTAAQQSCLTSNGITAPTPPAAGTDGTTGTKPAKVEPTAAQKTAFETAAKACGITLPSRGTAPSTAAA